MRRILTTVLYATCLIVTSSQAEPYQAGRGTQLITQNRRYGSTFASSRLAPSRRQKIKSPFQAVNLKLKVPTPTITPSPTRGATSTPTPMITPSPLPTLPASSPTATPTVPPVSETATPTPVRGSAVIPDLLHSLRLQNSGGTWADAWLVSVPNQLFTYAIQIRTSTRPPNIWDTQLLAPCAQGVSAGDVLLGSFYARGNGRLTFALQQSSPPWASSVVRPVAIEDLEWQRYYVAFQASHDYQPGGCQLALNVGFDPQIIELGAVELTNFGPLPSINALPDTRSYVGQGAQAAWRSAAEARIETHRKGDLTIRVVDSNGAPVEGATVELQMKKHAFKFGTAVDAGLITVNSSGATTYQRKLLELFNHSVVENHLKWQMFEWYRTTAENAVHWLRANGLTVRGHNLIWPSWRYLPADLEQNSGDPTYLRRRISTHIADIAGLFRGTLLNWDVVNEPVAERELLDILGDSALLDWFRDARRADPYAKLYLNDYDTYSRDGIFSPHQQAIMRLIEYLIENNAPLDGIGLQSHFEADLAGIPDVISSLQRYAQYGKELAVTEFDINTTDEKSQAAFTRDFITAAFAEPTVTQILIWGFWEGAHWLPKGAMYRGDWTEKANGAAWRDLIFNKWWTNERGSTDADGIVRVRGFLGDYEVKVLAEGRSVLKTAQLQTPGTEILFIIE